MPELVYKKAGHIELIRYSDSKRFLKFGVVQSLTPVINNLETELEDGNSNFPLTYSNGKTGNVQVNLNSYVPHIYAALTSMSHAKGEYDIRRIEEHTIPDSPYKVTLQGTPKAETLVVHDQSDSPFTSGGGAGQFTHSEKEVTFSSADAGKEVVVAYDETTAQAEKSSLESQSNLSVFRAIFTGEAVLRADEGVVKPDATTIDRVVPIGEIPKPPRQKTPAGWNFNLKVLPPRPDYKVVDYVVKQ